MDQARKTQIATEVSLATLGQREQLNALRAEAQLRGDMAFVKKADKLLIRIEKSIERYGLNY